MKVVSLFDGMACGLQALKQASIKVSEYHAFEIDKYAIQIAKKNHPEIIQHGSVVDANFTAFEGADLVIGGSPCQNFSMAGKRKGMTTVDNIEVTTLEQYLDLKEKGFEFKGQSYLFWEYVRTLREIKPKNFMLENVRMAKKWSDLISRELGVEHILIDSALVSAQRRKRNYWCNWKVNQPKDKGILLKDIVHENTWTGDKKSYCIDANYWKGASCQQWIDKKRRQRVFDDLEKYIVPFERTLQILDRETKAGKIGYLGTDSQGNRVYSIHDKSVTLTGQGGGKSGKTGLYLFGRITPDRIIKRQNGQRFNDGKKFYTLTAQDKHGVLIEGYIRKLTPVECERLQTLEDEYSFGVSDTQRYKMLGNGWTVSVIEHIFRELLKEQRK